MSQVASEGRLGSEFAEGLERPQEPDRLPHGGGNLALQDEEALLEGLRLVEQEGMELVDPVEVDASQWLQRFSVEFRHSIEFSGLVRGAGNSEPRWGGTRRNISVEFLHCQAKFWDKRT